MADQAPKLLRAKYAYKAANNDELDFSKGDIVTLTQVMDGGWWEGTLNGKTGWFPSNYVVEYKAVDDRTATKAPSAAVAAVGGATGTTGKSTESKREHHAIVTRSFVDTETAYVSELSTFVQTVLKPLSSASILSTGEYTTLCGNVEELLALHQAFLAFLVDCAKLPVIQQRVGGLFMKHAPKFKSAYYTYAANHPWAVTMLTKYKDELNRFMEARGASPPGSMALTTSLSVPFQRLDKYPSLLKELERHIDDAHVDRGDTQRAIAVYRDIQMSCTEIRKDKEMETEILNSPIKSWEGEDIHSLGDILLAANVQVYQSESSSGGSASAPGTKDRICLLFPSCIVLLSVTASLGYQYEGKILTTGVTVKKLEDTERWTNAVEISGSMIETIVLSFTSPQKQLRWYDRLMQINRKSPVPSKAVGSATPAAAAPGAVVALSPAVGSSTTAASQPAAAAVTQVTLAAASVPKVSAVPGNFKINAAATLPPPQQQRVLAQQGQGPTQPLPSHQHSQLFVRQLRTWSRGFCLRPLPPARPMLASRDDVGSGRTSPRLGRKTSTLGRRKTTIDDTKTLQKDSHILRVIEAYCTSTKTRHTVNSSVMDTPNMLIPEEEKIICEETKGDQTIIEEKSLVDTVYAIKDKLKEVQLEQSALRKELDEERRSRKKLEAYVMSNFKSNCGPHQTLVTCRQSSIEAVVASDGGAKS